MPGGRPSLLPPPPQDNQHNAGRKRDHDQRHEDPSRNGGSMGIRVWRQRSCSTCVCVWTPMNEQALDLPTSVNSKARTPLTAFADQSRRPAEAATQHAYVSGSIARVYVTYGGQLATAQK